MMNALQRSLYLKTIRQNTAMATLVIPRNTWRMSLNIRCVLSLFVDFTGVFVLQPRFIAAAGKHADLRMHEGAQVNRTMLNFIAVQLR